MTTRLDIRRYDESDRKAVWSLHNRALEETGAHGGNGPWDRDVADPISCHIDLGGEFLVGYIGQELAAMGAFIPRSEELIEIKRMRVDPTMQRRGLGKRILSELERVAVLRGFRRAKLDTTVQQIAAQALYQNSGYSVVGSGQEGRFKTVLFEKILQRGK
jgi:GNAT superfamily N-acetyltransferase